MLNARTSFMDKCLLVGTPSTIFGEIDLPHIRAGDAATPQRLMAHPLVVLECLNSGSVPLVNRQHLKIIRWIRVAS